MAMREDRFTQPKPIYKAPNDKYQVLTPVRKRFEPPSIPLSEQKENQSVSQLVKQAKALSGKITKEFPETKPYKAIAAAVKYCEAHILSDADFIKHTRSLSITDKGAIQLLVANGGKKYLDQGLLPAQAWDLLRKEKMAALVPPPNRSFDKHQKKSGKGYTPGIPTATERAAKIGMYLVRNEHSGDEE